MMKTETKIEEAIAAAIPTKTEALLEQADTYLLKTYNRLPVAWKKGKGVYLWDVGGKKYLDWVSGIAVNTLGYDHPRIGYALSKQARKPLHVSNLYVIPEQINLARALIAKTFPGRAFFCNSGAEANEAAIKFARKWGGLNGGRTEILTADQSFHGRTLATISASGQERLRVGFGPDMPGFRYFTYGDLGAARAAIGPQTVAIMIEPIQGEGGVRLPPKDYLKGLKDLCQEHHLLLILDEVQTGSGRTGTFCAYQQFGIVPDVITLAKGLGGGVPIGAMIVSEALADTLVPGEHASTFGGNPLACAVADEVLKTLDEEDVLENCLEVGSYFLDGLRDIEAQFEFVHNARGLGLLLAIDVDRSARTIMKNCLKRGLVVNAIQDKTLRFVPPLILKKKQVDEGMKILKEVLEESA